jgi:hypothetical protein
MPESIIRRNLSTILVAAVTAAVTGGGTAVAATVVDFARNADKVDNIHAAPATTTSRASKLIATDANGKLPAGIIPSTINVDKVDGLHAVTSGSTSKAGKLVATDSKGQFPTSVIPKDATPFAQYVVVRSDAGSAALNAARLQAKINGVAATKDKRYVVLVEPGAYDFGAGRLTMKPYVDVVGAGPGRTVVSSTGGATAGDAAVVLAADSALRQLSVTVLASNATAAPYVGGVAFDQYSGPAEVTDVEIDVAYSMPQSGAGRAYGVRHTGSANYLTLKRVDISVANGGVTNHGVYNTAFLTAEDTTAYANGGAPHNYGIETVGEASPYMTYSSVTLTDSAFYAYNGGVNWGLKSYDGGGTLVRTRLHGSIGLEGYTAADVYQGFEIDGGTIEGSASTVVLYPRNTAKVWRGAQLSGGPVNNFGGATGTVTCAGVHDENRTFFASSCPS